MLKKILTHRASFVALEIIGLWGGVQLASAGYDAVGFFVVLMACCGAYVEGWHRGCAP